MTMIGKHLESDKIDHEQKIMITIIAELRYLLDMPNNTLRIKMSHRYLMNLLIALGIGLQKSLRNYFLSLNLLYKKGFELNC